MRRTRGADPSSPALREASLRAGPTGLPCAKRACERSPRACPARSEPASGAHGPALREASLRAEPTGSSSGCHATPGKHLERAGGLDFVAELGPDAAEELAVLRAGLDHLDHAWTAEDLLHVEHLFDAPRPRAHDQDAVGQHDCLVDRMGDVHDRLAQLVPDAQQLGLQNELGLLIEGGERLVHEQHLGISGEGARDADALLHAAPELVWRRVYGPRQADLANEGLDDAVPLAAAEPLRLESKGDVV